jgi:hypothetical protein
MRVVLTLAMALLAVLGAAGRTEAQQGPGGRTLVAGVTLGCADFRGRPVQTYETSGLGDVARSTLYGRIPVITLDKEVMASLSGKLQIFFYLHECAHHVLGHMFAPQPESEKEADCWSIKTGRDQSYFNLTDVLAFTNRLASSPGSTRGHLPGPERMAHLLACFDED